MQNNHIIASGNGVNASSLTGNLTIAHNDISSSATTIFGSNVTGNVSIQANNLHGGAATLGIDVSNVGSGLGSTVNIGGSTPTDGNTIFLPLTGIAVGNAPSLTVQNNSLTGASQGLQLRGQLIDRNARSNVDGGGFASLAASQK